MIHQPNPHTIDWPDRQCWDQGYRQALFDCAHEFSKAGYIRGAQRIIDAAKLLDPRKDITDEVK